MKSLTYQEAVVAGIREEMLRDPRVIHLGLDIGPGFNGAMNSTKGLSAEFGASRIIDTPISEGAMVSAGVGAAMTGMRPIVQIMFAEFLSLALGPLACDGATIWYKSAGAARVPLVVRVLFGSGPHRGHAEDYHSWVASVPGLKVVMPSGPRDAKGLVKAAIRDDNPVVFFEHMGIYHGSREPVPDEDVTVPLGVASIKRAGTDVTLVATAMMVQQSLRAAEALAEQGISVEIIDPRTIVPMDKPTIIESVARTGRLVVVSETWRVGDPLADLIVSVVESLQEEARPRIARVSLADVPRVFAASLERLTVPNVQSIVDAVRRTLAEPRSACA